MSLWLNLIPQLHRPGDGDDVSMRHHHFQEEDDQYYDGWYQFKLPNSPILCFFLKYQGQLDHN